MLLERFAHETVDPNSLATTAPETLHALARKLGVETVVVTLGASGCFVSHGENRRGDDAAFYRIDGERVKAVDSTGAGDAFTGTLVAATIRLSGKPFRDAVVHANRAAAMSTEIVGTAPAMQTFDAVVGPFRRLIRYGKPPFIDTELGSPVHEDPHGGANMKWAGLYLIGFIILVGGGLAALWKLGLLQNVEPSGSSSAS